MILTTKIKNKLYHYFIKKLGSYNYSKGWLKSDCPSCGKHKFGVHLGLNRSNCFYCTYNPKPLELIMELENLDSPHLVMPILNDLTEVEYVEPVIEPHELKTETFLPDSFKNIRLGDNRFARVARKYLEGRGFDLKRLAYAGWGYCTTGKYKGYIIMPFYLDNRLIYFNARRFMGNGPKFNNPDIEDFGLGKSMIIYNRDALDMCKTVYLVESVTNSETIGGNSIATGGKKISNYQLNIILKSQVEKIIIGLDDDAIDDAIKIAFQLIDHKKVKILLMPKGRDINDIGKRATQRLALQNHYLSHRELLQLKNSL